MLAAFSPSFRGVFSKDTEPGHGTGASGLNPAHATRPSWRVDPAQYANVPYGDLEYRRRQPREVEWRYYSPRINFNLDAQLQAKFWDMYSFYKLAQMGISKGSDAERQLKNGEFAEKWEQLCEDTNDGSAIVIVASAKENLNKILGFTHAMRTLNPLSGEIDYFIEGTWVAPEERGQEIGTALLECLMGAASARCAQGLLWWTFDRNKNTTRLSDSSDPMLRATDVHGMSSTIGFYDNLRSSAGSREEQLGINGATTRAKMMIATFPITNDAHVLSAYKPSVVPDINETEIPRHSDLSFQRIAAGEILKGEYAEDIRSLYQKWLQQEGLPYARAEDLDDILKIADDRLGGLGDLHFLLVIKNNKPVGFALLNQHGVTMPRDTFASLDLRAVYIDENSHRWDQETANSLLQAVRDHATELNPKGRKFGLVRATLQYSHPLVPFLQDSIIHSEGSHYRAKPAPWRVFLLGLQEDSPYATHVAPYHPMEAAAE